MSLPVSRTFSPWASVRLVVEQDPNYAGGFAVYVKARVSNRTQRRVAGVRCQLVSIDPVEGSGRTATASFPPGALVVSFSYGPGATECDLDAELDFDVLAFENSSSRGLVTYVQEVFRAKRVVDLDSLAWEIRLTIGARDHGPIAVWFEIRKGVEGGTPLVSASSRGVRLFEPEVYDKRLPTDRGSPTVDFEQTEDKHKKVWKSPELADIELSPDEEAECQHLGFKSRIPVVVTGDRTRRTSNALFIGNLPCNLTDGEFILFLRLVVELLRGGDGYVGKQQLVGEPGIVPPEYERAIGRLRDKLQPALGELDAKRFVENSRRRIRISTHPRFIRVHRESLLHHDDALIRQLAMSLPLIGSG